MDKVIRWIETPKCNTCVNDIKSTKKERIAKLLYERSKCKKCVGCNRLEDLMFPGDDGCKNIKI